MSSLAAPTSSAAIIGAMCFAKSNIAKAEKPLAYDATAVGDPTLRFSSVGC